MFRKLFLQSAPTNRNILRWLSSVDLSSQQMSSSMQPSGGKSLCNGLSVRKVIAYVDASREVRSLKHMQIARQKFRHLEHLLQQNTDANQMCFGVGWDFSSLRKARINIDSCSCMLFRKFWLTLPFGLLFVYLYIDASPQWKGVELFAAALYMTVENAAEFFNDDSLCK